MRRLTFILVLLTLATACDRPAPPATSAATRPVLAYTPETFRQTLTALIDAKDYVGATLYVGAADVERQVKHDRSGYLAIGGDQVYLPIVGETSQYDPNRDWYVPGTSDFIEIGDQSAWQIAAEEFADQYNRLRFGTQENGRLPNAIRWYESVENTRQNPERLKAGEPDFVALHQWSHPLSRENALEMLLRTEIFCSTAVGVSAVTPPQCYAFKAILRQLDAAAAFGSLVRRGSPAGQLYGLCGLYLTDRASFEANIAPYLKNFDHVRFLSGCILDLTPISAIADDIDEEDGWAEIFRRAPDQPLN